MTRQPAGLENDAKIPYALRNDAFASALLDPDTEIPVGVGKKSDGADGVKSEKAVKRFSVYRNNVVVSLIEAMHAAYPSIAAIMGDENFKRVVRNFILIHPPTSPMMQKYGEAFPAFLENFKPLAKSPFLKDVARAELAWLQAFHARDEKVLTAEELQSVSEDAVMDLVLEPHPALYLVRSDFPVFDLFNARNQWPASGLDLAKPQSLLITRPVYDCLVYEIDEIIAVFFTKLCEGSTLGQAIGDVSQAHENFDPTLAISTLLQTGAFKTLARSHKN